MKILLIDDTPKHRRAGKRQLEVLGHDVVAVSTYGEALHRVQEEIFDAALLDLMMPAEAYMLGTEAQAEHLGREIGIGYPMVFAMALCGIKRIAVITDGNHHQHPVVATMDWFHGKSFMVNEAKVIFLYARLTEDMTKNFGQALENLFR